MTYVGAYIVVLGLLMAIRLIALEYKGKYNSTSTIITLCIYSLIIAGGVILAKM